MPPVIVVLSEQDPVASRLAERWGTPPSTGMFVDGAAVRQLSPTALVVRRPGRHIHDEHLDRRLPRDLAGGGATLVFPSIHRSEQNVSCLTVHPLGNPGPEAELGGRARTVVPTDPLGMAGALRELSGAATGTGFVATFEATHHGPELEVPAFFVEIGYGAAPEPPAPALTVLAEVIPRFVPAHGDRVAMAVGGGHYAPHFTDLVLRRRWAVGHILSRHALNQVDRSTAEQMLVKSPGAEGLLFARAADAGHAALRGLAPRLMESEAARRDGSGGPATRADRSTSGT